MPKCIVCHKPITKKQGRSYTLTPTRCTPYGHSARQISWHTDCESKPYACHTIHGICVKADEATGKQIRRESIYWKKFYEDNPQYNIMPDTVIIDPGPGPHV
jgi:hypothetical protein